MVSKAVLFISAGHCQISTCHTRRHGFAGGAEGKSFFTFRQCGAVISIDLNALKAESPLCASKCFVRQLFALSCLWHRTIGIRIRRGEWGGRLFRASEHSGAGALFAAACLWSAAPARAPVLSLLGPAARRPVRSPAPRSAACRPSALSAGQVRAVLAREGAQAGRNAAPARWRHRRHRPRRGRRPQALHPRRDHRRGSGHHGARASRGPPAGSGPGASGRGLAAAGPCALGDGLAAARPDARPDPGVRPEAASPRPDRAPPRPKPYPLRRRRAGGTGAAPKSEASGQIPPIPR